MAINFLTQAQGAVAAGPLDQVLTLLQNFGFFRVVLPFLLVFAIIYALIIKTGILGEAEKGPTKAVAAIVGMVVGFLVIAFTPVVDALTALLPQAAFLVVILVFLMIIFGMFGITEKGLGESKWAQILIGIIILIIFLAIAGISFCSSLPSLYGLAQFLMGNIIVEIPEEAIGLLAGIAVILIVVFSVIYLVMKSSSGTRL